MFHAPNKFRTRVGPMGSDNSEGNNGCFFIPRKKISGHPPLAIICSDGMGYEHVSVSLQKRCPTWDEMSFIKNLFWDKEDCVVQFHPPASEYVNSHPFCLHLWRKVGSEFETPPMFLVGPK